MKKKKVFIVTLIVILIAGGYLYFSQSVENQSSVKYTTTKVTKQNIVQSITATGTIEPVTLVDVGTQVSGILTTLYVDYNSVVKKGEVIAELDKSTLLLDRNSKKNNLEVAKSKYDYEMSNYARIKTLHEKNLIADSEYEQALYDYETSKNSYEIAKNDLERSETALGYATIYSPIDGVVLTRSVEEGQTVASSFSTPTLFTVAADLRDMRVIVDVDEADIGNVKEGQRAIFSVDAFPMDSFEGVVTQVRNDGIEASNVITYEVVVSASNPELKLKPGLTANVEVFVLDIECEKTVPASSLLFKPSTLPENKQDNSVIKGSTVWVKSGESIEPRRVEVGITNGVITEVGGVELGEEVVVGEKTINENKSSGEEPKSENPFVQTRPGRK